MSNTDNNERFGVSRRRLVQSLGGAGVAGLAGCAGGGTNTQEQTTTDGMADGTTTDGMADETTTTDGTDVQMGGELVSTFGADVNVFDPTQATDTTSAKAFGLVFEPLLSVDFQGEPQLLLAQSFEETGDLARRVTLREGVQFHDGSELTAEDVQATFERYEGTPNQVDVYSWYDSSEIVDDYTLDVTLSQEFGPLRFYLGGVPIVPAAAASDDLDLNEDPIGTGPYTFVEHDPDNLFRIERNEDYWFTGNGEMPDQPPIEEVTFRIIIDQSAQLAALQSGDVDLINGPPASSYSDLKDNDEFTLTERIAGGFDLMAFPLGMAPFDDPRVRRGVSRLIPRDAIIESVYQGTAIPATSPISPLVAERDERFATDDLNQRMGEEYLGYDPDRANQLLQEGFQEADVEAPFQTTIITNENPQRVQWCQLIQESLNSTEYFEASVEQFEWNTYVGRITSEDAYQQNNLIAVGWSGGWDPDEYIYDLLHSSTHTPDGLNIAHYASDEADQLIEDGRATYDVEERASIYQNLVEVLCRDAPITYIQFAREMDAFRPGDVHGFQTYPINGEEFKGIYDPAVNAFSYLGSNE